MRLGISALGRMLGVERDGLAVVLEGMESDGFFTCIAHEMLEAYQVWFWEFFPDWFE